MNENRTKAGAPGVTLCQDTLLFREFSLDAAPVVAEAARWGSGSRGPATTPAGAQGTDLTAFATVALTLGAQMLAYGADAGGVASLDGTVTQLAQRAESASAALATDITRASRSATEAAATATKEAAAQTAAALGAATSTAVLKIDSAVETATRVLQGELTRLLGGQDTPVARAVQQLVAQQMSESAVALQRTFSETLGTVSATLDVGNPGSPLAKLESRFGERAERQHAEVTAQLDRVREAVAAATAAASTITAVAAANAASPAKGRPFEEAVGLQMEEIAAGLGGTYTALGDSIGAIRGCKKGDGVLELPALDGVGAVRVVVEMTTTGASRKWAPYLAEAERNREAHASLGVVPSSDLVPGGSLIAPVGANRLVLAAAEGVDLGLLRSACVLLVLRAQRDLAGSRRGDDLGVVDERLAEAQRMLGALGDVLKTAAGVKAGASKVMSGIEAVQESVSRCLLQARCALGADAPAGEAAAA